MIYAFTRYDGQVHTEAARLLNAGGSMDKSREVGEGRLRAVQKKLDEKIFIHTFLVVIIITKHTQL